MCSSVVFHSELSTADMSIFTNSIAGDSNSADLSLPPPPSNASDPIDQDHISALVDSLLLHGNGRATKFDDTPTVRGDLQLVLSDRPMSSKEMVHIGHERHQRSYLTRMKIERLRHLLSLPHEFAIRLQYKGRPPYSATGRTAE